MNLTFFGLILDFNQRKKLTTRQTSYSRFFQIKKTKTNKKS